jgi:hypothetical protein
MVRAARHRESCSVDQHVRPLSSDPWAWSSMGALDLGARFVIDSLTFNRVNDKGGAHIQGAVDTDV